MTKASDAKTQARRAKLKTFIKVVNYQHLMPTRYSLEEESLRTVATMDVVNEGRDARGKVDATKKKAACTAAKAALEAKFRTGKQRWFFSKLRF